MYKKKSLFACRRQPSIFIVFTLWCCGHFFVSNTVVAQESTVSPDQLVFRRQATRRMIFDRSQQIQLAALEPREVVGFDLMHPAIDETGEILHSIEAGC
jgi:hypothetical protein